VPGYRITERNEITDELTGPGSKHPVVRLQPVYDIPERVAKGYGVLDEQRDHLEY
jgi:hypothetical protein